MSDGHLFTPPEMLRRGEAFCVNTGGLLNSLGREQVSLDHWRHMAGYTYQLPPG